MEVTLTFDVLSVRYRLEVEGVGASSVTAAMVYDVPGGDSSPDVLVGDSVRVVVLALHPDVSVAAARCGAGVVVASVGVDLCPVSNPLVEGS